MMKMKDMVDKVIAETGLPRGKAREVVDVVLTTLAENSLSGEDFTSPIVRAIPRTIPEKTVYDEATGQNKVVPERKQIVVRPTQTYLSSRSS